MALTRYILCLLGVTMIVTPAFAQNSRATQSLANLRTKHPEVRVLEHTGLVRMVYGRPMTSAPSPREAASEWLKQYADVFGATSPELVLESSRRVPQSKRVLVYRQYADGLPVEGSRVNVVVLAERTSRVVYVGAKVCAVPPNGFGAPAVASGTALVKAKEHLATRSLTDWSDPELMVVFADPTLRKIDGALAWKCIGSGGPGGRSAAVYIDARSGTVLRTVELTLSSESDITGTVTGNATPGTLPDIGGTGVCDNLPLNTPLPFLLVEALDGAGTVLAQTYTAPDGSYALTALGATSIRASLIGPSWTVADAAIPGLVPPLSKAVAPPLPIIRNFLFNAAPTVEKTAQVNSFLNVGKTWDYFKTRLANEGEPLPGLDDDILVLVNATTALCGAFYNQQPAAIYFGPEDALPGGGTCSNHAYSVIVSHEYGHYLADIMLGIGVAENGFHEGFSDTLGHLVHDTEVMGENFEGCCTLLRDPLNTRTTCQSIVLGNRQYPDCATAIHTRGMLLSGIWLNLLKNMRTTHSEQGLELTRQLHVDWCFITAGERPAHEDCVSIPQVADVGTLIEVLTADDDDGNFATGTPNCSQILEAFRSHNIIVDNTDIGLVCGEDNAIANGRGCAVDLDTTTGPGVLDLFDYIAFQRLFIARDTIACDCDMSTGPGVCDVFDFLCFQNAFVAGCP